MHLPRAQQRLVAGFLVVYGLALAFYCYKLQARERVDFPTYYTAARITFAEGGNPYGPQAFAAASREMGRAIYQFIYPPPSLLALAPLAYLSYPAAKGAFSAVSALAYLGAIWLLLVRLTPLPSQEWRRLLFIAIAAGYLAIYHASIATLRIGQINLLTLLFLCLALLPMQSRAPAWRTALPLSIAILLKTYPALLLLPLLLRRRFKEIILTCVFYGIVALVAAAVLPSSAWVSWLFEIVPSGSYARDASFAEPGNQNINGFVTRLFLPNPFCEPMLNSPALARPIATALALLALGVTVLVSFLRQRRGDAREDGDVEIAAFLLVIFLVAPLSWDSHLVLVLPAALLALSMLINGQLGRLEAVLVVAVLLLFLKGINLAHPALTKGWWTLLISIKFYAVLALWAFFIAKLARSGEVATSAAQR